MDTATAISIGMMNAGKEQMVFDWDEAARIIKTRQNETADAGLKSDYEWTAGTIFRNGKPVKNSYTYLASTWAVPMLIFNFGTEDMEEIPCYKMKHETKYDAHTKWPESALAILKG